MNQQTISHIRRQGNGGARLKVLCEKHGIGMVELRAILDMPKVVKRKKVSERDKAIAELTAEGYSHEAIAAVFGE